MKASIDKHPKRALVMGCGGVAGGAWTIAALHNLQQQLDWDVRQAEIMVGTSVGAALAALLGSGVSVERLMACQSGTERCDWNHNSDTGGRFPPLPHLSFTAPKLLLKGLLGQVSPLTAVSGLMPRGGFDMAPFRRLIQAAAKDSAWPQRSQVWLMTVDAQTGKRVAFGRDDAPSAALADAVCASYGVPAWCPPVNIAGRDYIDGGVASPTSADLLCDSDVEEVIVLAPMASSYADSPRSPLAKTERFFRRYMTAIVDSEVAQLRAAGKTVVRLEPNAEDLAAIGYNMMDPARRLQVFNRALETTKPAIQARYGELAY